MCAVSILQYQKKMLQAICSEPSNKDDYGISAFLSPRMSLAPIQQGNETITYIADTPFWNNAFGCYYVDMKYKIKNQSLVKNKQSLYPVSANWKNNPYTLAQNVTFTTTRTGKKKAFAAKKGTVVYQKRLYCNGSNGTIYVEMATKSGKKGWVKITDNALFEELVKNADY